MHEGKALRTVAFDSEKNPLNSICTSQGEYVKSYLKGSSVETVVIEEHYFDRDYLDEFSAFYGKSSRGYVNVCSRLHFFQKKFTSRLLNSAISGRERSVKKLQVGYLGFIVLRPLDVAPFGRTVFRWYPNVDKTSQRVTPTLRSYACNILGLKLEVRGTPWQQQDRGVSACATIALWSMFHSSAFDANHAVPTTVEITRNAHNGASGRRAFPSKGLSISELQEAVFSQDLTPKLLPPTISKEINGRVIQGFEPSYLASMCAANIRSGYPVLLVGDYIHTESSQQHAICCIGFREKEQENKAEGSCSTMDDMTEVLYVHDDNIGPNVRCILSEENGFAVLETAPPAYLDISPMVLQPTIAVKFRPAMLLIAVHNEIRMNAEELTLQGKKIADNMSELLNYAYGRAGHNKPALTYISQFLDVRNFLSGYLHSVFGENHSLLGKVRTSIGRDAPPLCLHIGLVSIGIVGNPMSRLMDIIYDTTDSSMSQRAVAHIIYDQNMKGLLDSFDPALVSQLLGSQVVGFN